MVSSECVGRVGLWDATGGPSTGAGGGVGWDVGGVQGTEGCGGKVLGGGD